MVKIPQTYEEYKALTSDELFELGWIDFDENTKNNILNFVKRSMIEEKMITLEKFIDKGNRDIILRGIALASGTKLSDNNKELIEYKYNFRIKNEQFYYCIKNKEKIIGVICIGKIDNTITINDFAIFEEFQKKGFGKETLSYIINMNKNFNIELGVEKGNIVAFNLYTSLGFKIFKEFEKGYFLRLENDI